MRKKVITLALVMVFLSAASFVFAEDVFVTQTGTKYHKEDCRLIKNRDGVKKIDKEEAVKEGYAPCRRCFKEDIQAADPLSQTEKKGIQDQSK